MAQPGHPPLPPHISGRRPGDPTLPSSTNPPHLPFSGPPLPPHKHSSRPPHQGHHEVQPAFVQPHPEDTTRSTAARTAHSSGDVAITLERFEPKDGGNQPDQEESDVDNSSFTSSTSSLVSNAPSVQHFNISFIFKKTFREHEGARAFESIRSILKIVYMCSLRWTYNILLFSVGILVAFLWAIINAAVAFLQAWIISPLTRVSLVIVKGVLPLILDPLSLILKACANGCGCSGAGGFQKLAGLQEAFRQA